MISPSSPFLTVRLPGATIIGVEVELPLTGRRIPIVADEHVDPAFGTGAVKVTPAHDPNDFEIGQRHDLPSITVLDERGVVTAPGPFQGLDRFEARPAVVEALRALGLIVDEKRPYVHAVGHCSRCGTVGTSIRDFAMSLSAPSMAPWSSSPAAFQRGVM